MGGSQRGYFFCPFPGGSRLILESGQSGHTLFPGREGGVERRNPLPATVGQPDGAVQPFLGGSAPSSAFLPCDLPHATAIGQRLPRPRRYAAAMPDVDGGTAMNLPVGITTVVVNGRLLTSDGLPCVGTVEWTPSVAVAYTGSDVTLLPKTVAATLDSQGKWTITLPCTDDPAGNPGVNRTFMVSEKMPGGRTRHVLLPLAVPVVDYADLVDVTPSDGVPTTPVVTYQTVTTVNGGTA